MGSLYGYVFLFYVLLVLLILLSNYERQRGAERRQAPPATHSERWARRKLRLGAYEMFTGEHGVRHVRLKQDVTIDGVRCKAGTTVSFSFQGQLTSATLAADQLIDGLPLAGGSRVYWHIEPYGLSSATLSRNKWIDGVPCAAGPIELIYGYRQRVRSARLFREVTLAGVRCQAGSRVAFFPSLFGKRLRFCVPVEETKQWGLWCAAGKPIDFEERSATLVYDIERAGVIVPGGCTFGHDIDWDFFWVRLPPGGVMVYGHQLPERLVLSFYRNDDGSKLRWWEMRAGSELPVVCAGSRDEPWVLAGHLPIQAHQYVSLRADGTVSTTLKQELTYGGITYAQGSTMTVDQQGRIIRWSIPSGPKVARGGPYRSPA